MKPSIGLFQQVRAVRFPRQADIENPLSMAQFPQAIHIRTEAVLYPKWQAPLAPFRVTFNKLEKILLLS
jgi:hypothetical protein